MVNTPTVKSFTAPKALTLSFSGWNISILHIYNPSIWYSLKFKHWMNKKHPAFDSLEFVVD